jgi:hypothetical protein
MIENVIIVGSGKTATDIRDWDIDTKTTKVVVVNNAWAVTSKWDYFIVSPDYTKELPAVDFLNPKQMFTRDGRLVYDPKAEKLALIPDRGYSAALFPFGGHEECGYAITLNAAYWTLLFLRPKRIGFIGCDMNYTPSEDGSTAFYGVGDDIKANGIPDPDRMVKVHLNDEPDGLDKIYKRFQTIANANNIEVVNFSKDEDTRLPYPQVEFN